VGLVGVKGRGALLGPEESGRLMGAVTVSSRAATAHEFVFVCGVWLGPGLHQTAGFFSVSGGFVLVSARILRTV
jgi:hypothetical protein